MELIEDALVVAQDATATNRFFAGSLKGTMTGSKIIAERTG
jgi:hypothetical protein